MVASAQDVDVRICLLGGFAISVGGAAADDRWRLRKAKTLVKLLALAPGHQLHRDSLLDALWPEHEPAAGTNNLHQALHAARRALGATHVVLRDDVILLEAVDVDVNEFEDAATKARVTGDLADLRAACALWTGELLPEDAYADWVASARNRLNELYAGLVTQLGIALTQAGEADEALATLEPLAQERPLDEPLARALLLALLEAGRRFDAIAAYERLRRALDTEYAAEPEPETKALYRRLLGATAPKAAAPHNLPVPTTSFIGRDRALHELASLLDRARMVTLTGPGGCGKSRLALELARHRAQTDEHPDGVWFAELAGITEAQLVPSVIAAAVGVALPVNRKPTDALVVQLAHRRLLLVLDNCEHLLDVCADLVTLLLARCAEVAIITTSREPLGVPGEVAFRVPSLELPSEGDQVAPSQLGRLEAVQLFVERARESVPNFALTEANAADVARVCHRLDGMPLALELAAARLAHLSVGQLAERLGDALGLLATHGRGRLDRQQTLAATLDWSHELLDDSERVVFRRLAIFAGGFDLEAAEYVCDLADVVGVLGRLVDKSLVHADTSGERARYRLLEVVRQYAEVRLAAAGDLAGCRLRHLEWYAARAAQYDPERGDPVVTEPSPWFDLEQDNIRAALATGLVEDPLRALELTTSTWRFWLSRGLLVDGARWLEESLRVCPDTAPNRVRALFAHGVLQIRQGLYQPLPALGDEIVAAAEQLGDRLTVLQARQQRAIFLFMAAHWSDAAEEVEATLALAHDAPAQVASLHNFAAVLALTTGDIPAARRHWDTALEALAAVPDDTPPFFTVIFIAWAVDERGPIPIAYGEETMLFGRRVGAVQARAHVQVGIAMVERLSGRLDQALALLADVAAVFDRIGDGLGLAHVLSQRGHTLRWLGRYDEAREDLLASERLRRQLRDHRGIALSISGRALVEAQVGNAQEARRLADEATSMMRLTGDEPGRQMSLQNAATVELLLGEWRAAVLSSDHLLQMSSIPGAHRSIGWQMLMRAHLLSRLGDPAGADAAAAQALEAFREIGERRGLAALQRGCKEGAFTLPDDRTL